MSLPGRIPDDPPITDHRKLAKEALAEAFGQPALPSNAAQVCLLTAIAHALLSIDGHLAKLSGHYRWVHR
jgi:hypothetical protein